MGGVPHFGAGDSTTFTAASALSGTIGKPANTAVGDLLVGIFYNQFSGGSIASGLSGWTAAATAIGPRSGGVYYLPVTDATVLGALPASWTVAFGSGQGGRLCFLIFRISGLSAAVLANPIDVVGAVATQNTTSPTVVNGVTAPTAGLLFALNYWNNSSTTVSTVAPDAQMTDGQQLASPTTGNTSGIDIAFQQLSAAGATGTRSFATSPAGSSNSGLLFVIKASGTAYTATASASAATSTSADAVASSGSAAGTIANAAATGSVALVGSVQAAQSMAASTTATVAQPIDQWMSSRPLYIAHRGGSADWDQSTMYAYDHAAAWSSVVALEAPVWKTADDVWVINHDNDLAQTGTWQNPGVGNITARNWVGDLQNVVSTNGFPMIRLLDLLAKYGSSRIIWIENKGSIDVPGFFTLLDSYAGASRYVIKQYYDNASVAAAAHSRGYKTWGYYYDGDAANLPSTAANWDILGMQYNASSASWTAAKSYGKPIIAHIIATAAQKATATANGADGFMSSGVIEVVPQTSSTAAQSVAAGTAATAQRISGAGASSSAAAAATATATRSLATGGPTSAEAGVLATATAGMTADARGDAHALASSSASTGMVASVTSAAIVAVVVTTANVGSGIARDLELTAARFPTRWAADVLPARFVADPVEVRWLVFPEKIMRTIYIVEGFTSRIGGTIRETQGKDIGSATIKVAFLPTSDVPPSTNSSAWVNPSEDEPGATPDRRVIKYLPPADTPAGLYRLWAWITDNPDEDPLILEDGIRVA